MTGQSFGMSRTTGRALDSRSAAHLEQSIGDILTTPERSRVMLRPYGSRLPDLVDQPDNPRTRLAIYAATAMALLRWEPRVQLTRVTLERPRPGALHLRILGRRVDLPRPEGFDFAYPLHPAPSAA
jgi:uncharacterized protein